MLARIAHELYWLGRNLTRAEFTARVVDGVFQLELQGQPPMPRRACSSAGRELARDARRSAGGPPATRFAGGAAAPDPRRRGARRRCAPSIERAREGARDRARRDQRRDVGGDQHDRPLPARRRHAGLARAGGPVPRLPLRQGARRARLRASATARCCATRARPSSTRAGTSSPRTWCCGCCASPSPRRTTQLAAAGPALALLQAVGGFQAFRRAVPAPPNAAAGRALPALRARLPRQRRGVRRRAPRARSRPPTRARATPSRCCASAGWRPTSSSSGARCPTDAEIGATCEVVQQELARVDQDVAERYFAGAGAPATTVV